MKANRFSGFWAAVLPLVILGSVLAFAFWGLRGLGDSGGDESLKVLKDALERAAVTCYALEGAYPPNVEYLEENYGVSIDRDRFFVSYGLEGSNLRPDIAVFQRQGGG